jgi:hypothetical protein
MTLGNMKEMDGASIESKFKAFAQGPWAGYNPGDNPTAVAPPVLPWEKMTLDNMKMMDGASIESKFGALA